MKKPLSLYPRVLAVCIVLISVCEPDVLFNFAFQMIECQPHTHAPDSAHLGAIDPTGEDVDPFGWPLLRSRLISNHPSRRSHIWPFSGDNLSNGAELFRFDPHSPDISLSHGSILSGEKNGAILLPRLCPISVRPGMIQENIWEYFTFWY